MFGGCGPHSLIDAFASTAQVTITIILTAQTHTHTHTYAYTNILPLYTTIVRVSHWNSKPQFGLPQYRQLVASANRNQSRGLQLPTSLPPLPSALRLLSLRRCCCVRIMCQRTVSRLQHNNSNGSKGSNNNTTNIIKVSANQAKPFEFSVLLLPKGAKVFGVVVLGARLVWSETHTQHTHTHTQTAHVHEGKTLHTLANTQEHSHNCRKVTFPVCNSANTERNWGIFKLPKKFRRSEMGCNYKQ